MRPETLRLREAEQPAEAMQPELLGTPSLPDHGQSHERDCAWDCGSLSFGHGCGALRGTVGD